MSSTLISTAELASRLSDPTLVILDVRHDLAQPDDWGAARYREAHIPGAQFVHLDRELSGRKSGNNGRHPLPPIEDCEALFSRLGIDAGKQVVVYDQGSGMYASRAWWMLRWLGQEAVAVLDGGFEKWRRELRPIDAEPVTVEPAEFRAANVGPLLGVNDIAASLGTGDLTLVDARAAERFRGEIEPLDPVAGHIPGARNRPYLDNVNADGTFKPADVLRSEFARLLGTTPLERVVHYCGSGVTACHNLLAMDIAGLPGTRLYPGSWSEWSADGERPVATGEEGSGQ